MSNASDIVVERLRSEILRGALEPGAPIRQHMIAKQLDVSRTPIRQALHHLAGEGLVTYDPNRGARVATIAASDIRDLFDMRLALEPIALDAALPHHDKVVFAQAEMAIDQAAGAGDAIELGRANAAFHNALYQPCRRRVLLETIARLTDRGVRAEIVILSISARVEKSAAEHRALLDACRAGEVQAALHHLHLHLAAARDDTLDAINSPSDIQPVKES